jgi:hypothetical protein
MAWESDLKCQTYEAGADLSASQFRFVEQGTDAKVTLCNAATDVPCGVLQDKPSASGQACSVAFGGFTKLVAGAVIDEGDQLGTDTQGRAVPLTIGTDTTKYVAAIARMPASAAGVIFTAQLVTPHRAA